MKKIDELLEHIQLREEDYEMFQEEPVTDEELQEIKNRVLEGVRKEQIEKEQVQKEQIADLATPELETKIKRKRKRWILPLVATLAIGSSLVAEVANGNLGEIFHVIFGENTANIGDSGLELGISDTKQGITLNVQGIVGDKQNAILLFDIEKEEEQPFIGNNIEFGKLNFKVEEKKSLKGWNPFKLYSTTESSGSFGWGLIDEGYQQPNRLTFKLDATLDQNLIGAEGILEIEDITEIESGDWESEVDLVAFFKAHPELLSQVSIPMPEELIHYSSTEELKYEGYTADEIEEIMNDIPKRGLSSKNLGLDLYPEFESNWIVDNIGFIGDQLHIRMSGAGRKHYTPAFKDASGNEVEMTYNITTYSSSEEGEGVSGGYYVYNIKDIEALNKVRLSTYFSKEIETIKGKWQVRFKIDIKNQEKNIQTDQTIPWIEDTKLEIEEMKLSNLSLKVTYKGGKLHNYPRVYVQFKDGKEQEAFRHGATYGENMAECTYAFAAPIDVSEVEAIRINEVEIPVE